MRPFADPAARTACAVRAMVPKRPIEQSSLKWRDIAITVVYTPDFHGVPGDPFHHCHLEVMSQRPRVALPISETGYRSVFLPGGTIDDAGGAVCYATRWLEHASQSRQWKAIERDRRQGSLF